MYTKVEEESTKDKLQDMGVMHELIHQERSGQLLVARYLRPITEAEIDSIFLCKSGAFLFSQCKSGQFLIAQTVPFQANQEIIGKLLVT